MGLVKFDIIKNGSFTQTEYIDIGYEEPVLAFKDWTSDYEWVMDENDNSGVQVRRPVASQGYDEELDCTCCNINTLQYYTGSSYNLIPPPGISQHCDLSKISYNSYIEIDFYAKNISGNKGITIWLYSADSDGNRGELVSKVQGTLTASWEHYHHTFYVNASQHYLIMITGLLRANGSSDPYNFFIRDFRGILSQKVCPYTNLIVNGDFESTTNGKIDKWDTHYAYPIETIEDGVINRHCHMSKKDFESGRNLEQMITVPEVVDGYPFDFYYADITFSLVDGDYFVNKKKTNEEKYIIDAYLTNINSNGYVNILHNWKWQANSSWHTETLILKNFSETLQPGNYYLTLHALNSRGANYECNVVIDNVSVNIYSYCMLQHAGTFDDPYTISDGRIVYSSRNKFMFFDDTLPSSEGFAYLDGSYYAVETSGMYSEGFHEIQGRQVYTYPDGRVAISEKFIYEDKIYQADENGAYVYLCDKLSYINVMFKGYRVNSRVVEVPIGIVTLQLNFPEQISDVTLTIDETDHENAIRIISLTPGKKNNVLRLSTDLGEASLKITYKNIDKTTTVAYVDFKIVRGEEYEEELSLNITKDNHYVGLESSLKIPYIIRPRLASTITIDWLSSDESVAIVDVFGNILPKSIGTCTITAISYNAEISDTCTLHVVEQTAKAASITLSETSVSIGIADSAYIESTVKSTSGEIVNVNQEVVWISENTQVAIVDGNGVITGVGEGITNIYCCSYEDNTVRTAVEVTVSGQVTAINDIELSMYETMLDANNPSRVEYITWTLIPPNTNQTEVIWTSSNPDAVKVAINGRISIGDNPQLNIPVPVKCTSVSNPEIYRECYVTVVDSGYKPTITIKQSSIRTYIGQTVTVDYGISQGYRIEDVKLTKANGDSTTNIVKQNVADDQVNITAMEEGEFILTLSCGTVKKTCEIVIFKAEDAPQFINNVQVLYVFQNGSYILKYFAVDAGDDLNLEHYVCLDNEDYFSSAKAELLYYDGEEEFYMFGDGVKPGIHTIKVRVVDTDGRETVSNSVSLVIPDSSDKKTALRTSKEVYDAIKIDLINYLNEIIEDGKMNVNDKRGFTTRYKLFNAGYDNLLDILDECVKHINSQIETSQSEMAALSNNLDGGVSVATYSEGDYTNSNFETVTDMDYYQNECIKKLAARIFELEARLEELANNNN